MTAFLYQRSLIIQTPAKKPRRSGVSVYGAGIATRSRAAFVDDYGFFDSSLILSLMPPTVFCTLPFT